ncbi:MAG TPA: hypothetical protein VEL72_01815 [Ktedonobacteraceae bacterium]|nr:hypothetical protein [Ktedonobacteraceae bacterium]
MKRWMLLLLLLVIVMLAVSLLVLRQRLASSSQLSPSHLARTPHSAYKYDLCIEAFAYAHASPDEPHKTDYTFHDPFRMTDDTIIPYLMDWNPSENTASFKVIIIVGQVNTFTETIAHVRALDGISIMLPDRQNQLQRASEPQFIVSSLIQGGGIAVLDFTCPQQWQWKAVATF